MEIFQTWSFQTGDLQSTGDLQHLNLRGRYTYVPNPAVQQLKASILEKNVFQWPYVLADPRLDSFLTLTPYDHLKVNERVFYVNNNQLLPGIVSQEAPFLQIDFVDLYGDARKSDTSLMHVYRIQSKARPNYPRVLLPGNRLCAIHFIDTPRLGDQVQYNGETMEVYARKGDLFELHDRNGEKRLVLPTEFESKWHMLNPLDVNGSEISRTANVLGTDLFSQKAVIGDVFYLGTADAPKGVHTIINSRGTHRVNQVMLLPSDRELQELTKQQIGKLFTDRFEDYAKMFPNVSLDEYRKPPRPQQSIPTPIIIKPDPHPVKPRPRRRLYSGKDLTDFEYFYANDSVFCNFPFPGFVRSKVAKFNPPQVQLYTGDGEILVPLSLGRRPSPEYLIIVAWELCFDLLDSDYHTRFEVPSGKLSFYQIFREQAFIDDTYAPKQLFTSKDPMEFIFQAMHDLGYDPPDEKKASAIVPTLLLPGKDTKWIPVSGLQSTTQTKSLLSHLLVAVNLWEELKNHERSNVYKYLVELQKAIKLRDVELSNSELNAFRQQESENLKISQKFYDRLVRLRKKSHVETAEDIVAFMQVFLAMMNKFNQDHDTDWKWSQFLDDQYRLNTPSNRARDNQQQTLSFRKNTDQERYSFFWRVFRNTVFKLPTEERPVFISAEERAREFLKSVISDVQEQVVPPPDAEGDGGDIGMFSILVVGGLFLAAAWALQN